MKEKEIAMATLDWSQCPAVESVPGKLGGAWVFKNTRMPVSAVFENLEAGATVGEIMVTERRVGLSWRIHIERVAAAFNAATPGSYAQIDIPLPPKEPFTRS